MDGHCGRKAAIFTRDHLQARVLSNLCRPDATVVGALTSAFEEIDSEFMSSTDSDSGTTCVAMLIELSTGQCWVANAGDSRCILARGADTVALSVDHRADRPDEILRIEKAGGMVLCTTLSDYNYT
jgi:serine/threonine protein phosphatase PrpC